MNSRNCRVFYVNSTYSQVLGSLPRVPCTTYRKVLGRGVAGNNFHKETKKASFPNIHQLISVLVEWIERLLLKRLPTGLISGRFKPNTIKTGIHSFAVFTASATKGDSVKPPRCVVDRWEDGSLIRKLKGPLAAS